MGREPAFRSWVYDAVRETTTHVTEVKKHTQDTWFKKRNRACISSYSSVATEMSRLTLDACMGGGIQLGVKTMFHQLGNRLMQ